jgi:methylenetetrahydrofolate reductase (NADPH)
MQLSFSILNLKVSRNSEVSNTIALEEEMTKIAAVSHSVFAMLRGYSIEVNPGQAKVVDAAVERLDVGTEVFLSWIPGSDPMDMIEPSARMRRAGLYPVPHVGARHLESAAQLEYFAESLVSEALVDRILVIGGDRAKPAGPYDSTLAVLQTGIFQNLGVNRVAVAGFPEGNPHITESVVNEALAAKVNFARSNGLQLSIVTQFGFEAAPIVGWLRRIRARGMDVPIQVGLAGPAGILTLARYAVRCGIGNSLHVLTENPTFARLLTEKGPEPIIRDIAAAAEAGNQGPLPFGIARLHFYVFGGFNKTVDWINAQLAAHHALRST